MGTKINDAKKYADEIRRLFDNTGKDGYAQANFLYKRLSELATSANKSKNNKADVEIILDIRKSISPLLEVMKQREKQL